MTLEHAHNQMTTEESGHEFMHPMCCMLNNIIHMGKTIGAQMLEHKSGVISGQIYGRLLSLNCHITIVLETNKVAEGVYVSFNNYLENIKQKNKIQNQVLVAKIKVIQSRGHDGYLCRVIQHMFWQQGKKLTTERNKVIMA